MLGTYKLRFSRMFNLHEVLWLASYIQTLVFSIHFTTQVMHGETIQRRTCVDDEEAALSISNSDILYSISGQISWSQALKCSTLPASEPSRVQPLRKIKNQHLLLFLTHYLCTSNSHFTTCSANICILAQAAEVHRELRFEGIRHVAQSLLSMACSL